MFFGKNEKSVVDQISQCSSAVVKNPKNSYDIFINAYSYCNSRIHDILVKDVLVKDTLVMDILVTA